MSLDLAFDLDNVLENLTECFLEIYNEDSGDNLKIEDITKYRIEEFMKPEFITHEHLAKYFGLACYNLQPLEHSQKYLTKLHNEGFNIDIVTTSHFCDMEIKLEFLKKYFPFLTRRNVYVMPSKQKFKCDVLVDDCVDNLIGGTYARILFNQPWNQGINDKELKIHRAYDWGDVYDLVHSIERNKVLYGSCWID